MGNEIKNAQKTEEKKVSVFGKKIKTGLKSKKFKHGTMSTAFIVLVIVIAIIINVLASALVERFPSLNVDMSTNQRMTVNDTVLEVVKNLNTDVSINFLAEEEIVIDNYGDEAVYVTETLKKMVEASHGKLTVNYVDLEKNPAYTAKYTSENALSSNNIIIESDKRYRILNIWGQQGTDSIFQTEAEYNEDSGSYDYTYYNDANSQFASALIAVTSDDIPVVAFATGNNEADSSAFKALLTSNGFECKDVNLFTANEIGEDVDVLVLYAPTEDLDSTELAMVEDFLDNNGQLEKHLFVALTAEKKPMPNLNTLLNEIGINIMEDTYSYVLEDDANNYYKKNTYPLLRVADMTTDTMLEGLTNTNYLVGYVPVAVEVTAEALPGISVETLVKTYDTAYGVPSGADESYTPDKKSEFPILINAQKIANYSGNAVATNYMVCASAEMFNSTFLNLSSLSNSAVLLSAFKNLVGESENAYVYVAPVQIQTANLAMSASQVLAWGLWVFTIAIPVVVLAIGFVIWRRRRHL